MKRIGKNSILAVAALAVVFVLVGLVGSSPVGAATAIDLGAADSFAVLSGTPNLVNTGSSVITGDIGLSPATGAGITGFPPGVVVGTIYAVDAAGPAGSVADPTLLTAAKNALTAAYLAAASSTPATTITSDLGTFNGGTLSPGTYNSASSIGLTGTLTLDGGGDPNAVFIFQAGSSLTTAASSSVVLTNGAQACNVYWQIGSSAGTLGTNSIFKGNLLSLTSITLLTGANLEGRALARNGAVTLDSNIITKPTCVTPAGVTVTSSGGSGGVPPLIDLIKTPTPLTLPLGGGSVTYTYYVTNIGTVQMRSVNLTDNRCPSQNMKFVASSKNSLLTAVDSNTYLAVNETWTYTCATNLKETTKNIAVVTGMANGVTAADTAVATVAVGLALPPPLIHVVKVPSAFLLPAGGGAVTYSYFVTNPGTAPLHDVSIVDNKCTGLPGRVEGHPGDINKNNLLDPGETFYFTCATQIGQTTVNTAIAEGSANGLTAIDFAHATVVVSSPMLPNTGLPEDKNSVPLGTAILFGILTLAGVSAIAVRKKQTVGN